MDTTKPDSPDGNQETTVKKMPTVEELLAERERMAAALKDANKESADRRKRLEALESAEKARAEAAMSETEKAAAKAKELEAQLNATVAELTETKISTAIEREAVRLGFTDPSDAAVMIDRKAISIDGKSVTGVKEALEALAKAKPYLLRSATVAQTGTAGKPSTRTIGAAATTQPVVTGVRF